ncbi:MAG: flagellin lysine-N-methylase [Lachnospiraceae bacterium]|nr:flagellin lysine-N-methylase [Lachnospiraceae bacterium]
MRVVKQKAYDGFSCVNSECSDNCCHGWQIDIDEDSLSYFREYKGALKSLIDEAVDYENSCIKMNGNGHCALLNKKGLCRLVLEEGEDVLSTVCHMYPRHVEEYDGLREWSISLSCPVAADTLIRNTGKNEYVCEEDDLPDPLEDDFDDFDTFFFTRLCDSRDVIFDILDNNKLSIYSRMKHILEFGKKLQGLLEENDIIGMDDIIDEYSDGEKLLNDPSDKESLVKMVFENDPVLYRMERLDHKWDDELVMLNLFHEKHTADEISSFDLSLLNAPDHEKILENVLHTFIYTYYLGAVYDDEIYAKLSMSVFCTLLIDELFVIGCIMEDKEPVIEDYVHIAYRFAKETEHSDINLDMLEEHCDKL